MPKRKKRLKKGIESLEEQIEYHKLKLAEAREKDNFELEEYYQKEIQSLEIAKKRKEDKL